MQENDAITWAGAGRGIAALTVLCSTVIFTQTQPSFTPRLCASVFGAIAVFVFVLFPPYRRPRTTHGSAGWMTTSRNPDLLFRTAAALPAGSMLLSRTKSHVIALPPVMAQQHGVIVGGTGTGKSRGYFLPNAALSIGASLVLTDPKAELWRHTSGFHSKARRFAPTEPCRSEAFNWIPLCKDPRVAETSARAIIESGNTHQTDQAWIDTETAFLAALFSHAATLQEPTPLTAYRLFTRQPQETLLEQLLNSQSEAAREQAVIFTQTSERMRGVIVPVVAARLQFMRDQAVAMFTSASIEPPDFRSLRSEPQALYYCLREQDIVRLRALTSLFFTLLLEDIAEASENGIPVLMLLDEFANIGIIPNFETTITVARGRGVSLWLGIQSLSQLEARYGRVNARTILSNCGTKIALHGLDFETADYVSKTLGITTVTTPQRARQHRRGDLLGPTSTTRSDAFHGRALLTPDEVRRIGDDEAIVIIGNRRPMTIAKHYYRDAPNEAQTKALGEARSGAFKDIETVLPEERHEGKVVPFARRPGKLRTL